MNIKDIINKEVYDINAKRIGRVIDLVFDLPQGRISHIVVKTGLIKKREIKIEFINKTGDTIPLTVPADKL